MELIEKIIMFIVLIGFTNLLVGYILVFIVTMKNIFG